MDEIIIKTPNLKCRLYLCLIEFIDWRYSQSCWYFRPLLWNIAPLTFSLVHLLPFPVWICTGLCIYTVCNRGGGEGIGLCGDHIQELYTVNLTRFRNQQNCFTTPNKNLGGKGASDKQLPPSPFTGCSTTGKPTRSFATERVSLDSV